MRFLVLVLVLLAGAARAETNLPWQKWSPALFDRAAKEDKYILLHMAAVWCHWCHVMEGTTYRDPAIQKAILDRFIPVRVDQDSDPELSYRYEQWGWPATIMLDKDGNEIFKRRGYIAPELFAQLLAAVIEDPSALPSYALGATVDPNAVGLSDTRRIRIEALTAPCRHSAGSSRANRGPNADLWPNTSRMCAVREASSSNSAYATSVSSELRTRAASEPRG